MHLPLYSANSVSETQDLDELSRVMAKFTHCPMLNGVAVAVGVRDGVGVGDGPGV
jgi:hypothetical protein